MILLYHYVMNKMRVPYRESLLTGLAIFMLVAHSYGQETALVLTLSDAIGRAQANSPKIVEAETILENQYWQYQTFRSNYRPQIRLAGQLPNFNRTIAPITQNDGSEAFKPRSYSNSSLNLGMSQKIGLTGGEISIGSQIGRIDQFTDTSTVSYLASPAVITYQQPLFAFNPYKWDKEIEPLRYESSKRQYLENKENVSLDATILFFELLLAQESSKISQLNVHNSDTIYQIAKGRYQLGKIAESGLLQMELSLMNAKRDLALAEMDMDLSSLELAMFLGLTGKEVISVAIPDELPEFIVDEDDALNQATANSSRTLNFEIRRLEGHRLIGQAKGESGINANLFTSYGVTNSTMVFDELYTDPIDKQLILLGFDIPIIDWGRSKAQIRTAEANKKLIDVMVLQDEQSFKQEIYLTVRRFNIYRQNLFIAEKADQIAQKRYAVTFSRYMIGKVVTLDLKDAQEEKDLSRRAYIRALADAWNSYYELRLKTLYDFDKKKLIEE